MHVAGATLATRHYPGKAGSSTNLKDSLGSVALHVLPVNDDLYDAVPHLFRHVVAGDADQVQYHVHVPGVVSGVLLGQDGYLQYLEKGGKRGGGAWVRGKRGVLMLGTRHGYQTRLSTCLVFNGNDNLYS